MTTLRETIGLALMALIMVAALVYQNVAYRGVPDAAGTVFNCAFEVAGFAWFCDD